MFLYSVGPSRIDQVIQCDLLHVTAYVTARVPILFIVCIHRHSKKGQSDIYGTPRLPYNVYILFVMYKGHFVMYKFNLLCAKCISL